MEPTDFPDGDALKRQMRQRLEGLQASGVDWLPRMEPLIIPNAQSQEPPIPKDEPPDPNSPEGRRRELTVLAKQVAGCTRCPELVATRSQTVFGVGPINPDLCLIGEAPGADEDRVGEPFVGAAGQLLTRIIQACGMTRQEVFICNILRCRPPGNRQPKIEEAANCRGFLDQTLALVRPKYICCLGATAAQRLLNSSLSIGRMRGKFYDYQGIPVICTYHPASLLPTRSPENKKLVWEDMKLLLSRMGREIPQGKKE